MPKVSVILPIYNAEPYLRQCLDSVKNQTLNDIEVLCVNDGSTDDSLSIMTEYAEEDDRFIVLDKPNGGYGHSLNYGLARAHGDYIAIVEPDDFIDAHMYEDLIRLSVLSDGSHADVVKGGYWEYFDARDGYSASLLTPNLLRFMPKEPVVFTLAENPEVFCHHPSIWSAIYRRDFLDMNEIRFVEPKGAGWADNPFFVQTLVSASSIVWVPGGYYYYRQTNTGSSSFLKDFHIPFDRLREMRAFLSSRNDLSGDVLAAFYLREFDYINSVIGEFGFDEADPEIQQLIFETLTSMNSDIVLTNPRIRPDDIRYYVEFFDVMPSNKGDFSIEASDIENPLLTIIVPLKDDRPYLGKTIKSIVEGVGSDVEVIFVDCGSADRSKPICEAAASKDRRLMVIDEPYEDYHDGLNAALNQAKGRYFFILLPRFALKEDVVYETAQQAEAHDLDVVIFDESGRFCTRVIRALDGGCLPPASLDQDSRLYAPVSSSQATEFLFNMGAMNLSSKMYKTDFIRSGKLAFDKTDGISGNLFFARAMLMNAQFGYRAISHLELDEKEFRRPSVPFILDVHTYDSKEDPLAIDSAFEVLRMCERFEGRYARTTANLLIDAFTVDLSSRNTVESLEAYVDANLSRVRQFVDRMEIDGAKIYSVDAFNNVQILQNEGFSDYFVRQYLAAAKERNLLQKTFKDFLNSRKYQFGEQFSEMAKKLLPGKIVARIRAAIAMR